MTVIASPPTQDSVIELDPRDPERRTPFTMARVWIVWLLQSLIPRISASPEVLQSNKEYANQNTSIGTTSIPTGILSAGAYRVEYTLRVTVADGVSSSVQLAIGWTDSAGVALTQNAAPLAADNVTVVQTGGLRVAIAGNSTITFNTTYASNTPGKMRYRLQFSVTRIGPV
jgi:hypothetical protein